MIVTSLKMSRQIENGIKNNINTIFSSQKIKKMHTKYHIKNKMDTNGIMQIFIKSIFEHDIEMTKSYTIYVARVLIFIKKTV